MKRPFPSEEVDQQIVVADAMEPIQEPILLTHAMESIQEPILLTDINSNSNSSEELTRRAEMYQEYMKQIPIPRYRASVIPFTSWMGLGKSIKQLYGQPLHYLTNVALKRWDQMRIGSEDEWKHLDDIIHPCKGEASIWLMEEIHRQTSSAYHIANLWKKDPMYSGFIDPIFPKSEHTS